MPHPFAPIRDALELSVVRAACYFGAWCIGLSLPSWSESLVYGNISGYDYRYWGEGLGPTTMSLVFHPIGWIILSTNLVLFAIFVRFEIKYRWITWPLITALLWGILAHSK